MERSRSAWANNSAQTQSDFFFFGVTGRCSHDPATWPFEKQNQRKQSPNFRPRLFFSHCWTTRSECHNLQVRCFRHQLYRSVCQDLDVETEVVTICTCVVQGAGQIKEQGDRGWSRPSGQSVVRDLWEKMWLACENFFSVRKARSQLQPTARWTCTSLGCALLRRDHREGSRGLTRLPADGAPAVLLTFLSWAADGAHHVHDCLRLSWTHSQSWLFVSPDTWAQMLLPAETNKHWWCVLVCCLFVSTHQKIKKKMSVRTCQTETLVVLSVFLCDAGPAEIGMRAHSASVLGTWWNSVFCLLNYWAFLDWFGESGCLGRWTFPAVCRIVPSLRQLQNFCNIWMPRGSGLLCFPFPAVFFRIVCVVSWCSRHAKVFCAIETKSGEQGTDTPTQKMPVLIPTHVCAEKTNSRRRRHFCWDRWSQDTSLHDDLRFQTSVSICGQVS